MGMKIQVAFGHDIDWSGQQETIPECHRELTLYI